MIATMNNRQQDFANTGALLTKKRRCDRSPAERLIALEDRYPSAPAALLHLIAQHETLKDFGRKLMDTQAVKVRQATLEAVTVNLGSILRAQYSGLGNDQVPNYTLSAAAEIAGQSIEVFIHVPTDQERLEQLQKRHPQAPDALLQVMVPHKSQGKFCGALLNYEPFKTMKSGLQPLTIISQVESILQAEHSGTTRWGMDVQGNRGPSDLILTIAAMTGLNYRFFLRSQYGGLPLPEGQIVTYNYKRQTYALAAKENPVLPAHTSTVMQGSPLPL